MGTSVKLGVTAESNEGDAMTGTTDTISKFKELDYRENDGIEVSLLWSRIDNSLTVRVVDKKTDEKFRLAVQAHDAMDVFRHPFAYARAA
jgi:hypothetical protein